ncbi:MAG: hypothetical protein NXI04_07665 [Planctomycetaceae bacterium]|nr:hypothetical protein [Planctomycetaceae bacterium]
MKRLSLILCLTVVGSLTGCQSTAPQETVEAESRRQSQRITELENRLAESERLLADQDRELQALRSRPADGVVQVGFVGDSPETHMSSGMAPEVMADWAGVSGLRIHRLTSGLSKDHSAFHLVLQPLDSDQELRKVAGRIEVSVTLLEPGQPPVGLATYSLSLTDSRRTWVRGLVSSGFQLDVPLDKSQWPARPGDARLAVAASLDLGTDRVYSASEIFDVTP